MRSAVRQIECLLLSDKSASLNSDAIIVALIHLQDVFARLKANVLDKTLFDRILPIVLHIFVIVTHLAARASHKVNGLDQTLVDRFFTLVSQFHMALLHNFIRAVYIEVAVASISEVITWLTHQFPTHVADQLQLGGLQHGHHSEQLHSLVLHVTDKVELLGDLRLSIIENLSITASAAAVSHQTELRWYLADTNIHTQEVFCFFMTVFTEARGRSSLPEE